MLLANKVLGDVAGRGSSRVARMDEICLDTLHSVHIASVALTFCPYIVRSLSPRIQIARLKSCLDLSADSHNSLPLFIMPSKKGKAREQRQQSSSRQSTPLSNLESTPPTPNVGTPTTSAPGPTHPKETAYLHTPTSALISNASSIEALILDRSTHTTKGDPPSAKDLHAIHDRVKDSVARFMGRRGEVCDRSMRQLVQKRKEKEREHAEAQHAAAASSRVKEKEEEKKSKKVGRKRSHDEMEIDEESEKKERKDSLPSVGAHGVARQDGVGVHEGMSNIFISLSRVRVLVNALAYVM